jgi:hypothetical protein
MDNLLGHLPPAQILETGEQLVRSDGDLRPIRQVGVDFSTIPGVPRKAG